MIDRRGFIGLMLGAAVAPKGVIQGLVTPAPVKEAISVSSWVCHQANVEEIIKNMKEGDLVAFVVEVTLNGMDVSDEVWKTRSSGSLKVEADPV